MSAGLANAYMDSKQLDVSHVAIMALLLSQNSLRSNLSASNFRGGACPSLSCSFMHIHTYQTPPLTSLLKILATGLKMLVLSIVNAKEMYTQTLDTTISKMLVFHNLSNANAT